MKSCIASSLEIDYANPKIIMIDNSLEIEHILVSEALIEETNNIPNLEIESEPFYLEFDKDGNLLTSILKK